MPSHAQSKGSNLPKLPNLPKLLLRKILGGRGNVKSSLLFTTLLALSFVTAIISMMSSYDIQDRHLNYADTREVLLDDTIRDADVQKKCALLFFGPLEGFEALSLPTIRRNIIAPNPHCDVFLHTYDVDEVRNQEAYLLTDNVISETTDSFYHQRKTFLEHTREYFYQGPAREQCCESHDNMVKQWHSIKGVWNLMQQHEKMKLSDDIDNVDKIYYEQVGLFQSNVYYVNPVNIFDSNASLPDHSHYGGYNDRMFYGQHEYANIWTDRFSFAQKFEKRLMKKNNESNTNAENKFTGYHPESYLRHLLTHRGVKVLPKPICTWKILSSLRLKANDCDDLEEYASEKIEYVPPGYVLSGNGKIAEHWSTAWDTAKVGEGGNYTLPVPKENDYHKERRRTTGFMILGMHRSGTSMLASLLANGFGYKYANDQNADQGSFELKTIVRQNDAFMWGQNITWDSNVQKYDPERAIQNLQDRSVPTSCGANGLKFLNESKNFPWLQKDPRMCITLKTWLPILESKPATIFTYRHPLEVAKSLQKRNGFNLKDALDLWIHYNKAAIQNSANLCRVVTSHKAIVENPLKEARRISDGMTTCGVPAPPSTLTQKMIGALVHPSLHNNSTMENHALNVLEEHGDCKIYEYESEFGEGTSSREIEVDSYLKAMKMYCDLESGLAYQRNYAWPELNRSFSSEKSIEQKAQTENKLRKLYRTCASEKTAEDDKESAKEEEESYDSEDDGYSCVSKSPHSFNHTLARFIIFQRDLGPKLQDLVAHYTSAVPYDSMVIIDHEGEDQTTEMNLKHYASRGAHIWRCEGSFDYKPEMWSGIVGHYKEKSDFVFPIDGDEYMAVLRRDGDTQSLHWTYEDLRRELMYLQKVGKMALPFKTLRSIPIPSDCNMEDHPGKALMKGRVHDDSVGVGLAPSPMCQIKYTASDLRHYCYNKCFYRGDECTEVDKGNHGIEKCLWPCSDEYGFSRDPSEVCPIEPSVNATFNLSNLTLLHLQSNEFSDFVFRRHCT